MASLPATAKTRRASLLIGHRRHNDPCPPRTDDAPVHREHHICVLRVAYNARSAARRRGSNTSSSDSSTRPTMTWSPASQVTVTPVAATTALSSSHSHGWGKDRAVAAAALDTSSAYVVVQLRRSCAGALPHDHSLHASSSTCIQNKMNVSNINTNKNSNGSPEALDKSRHHNLFMINGNNNNNNHNYTAHYYNRHSDDYQVRNYTRDTLTPHRGASLTSIPPSTRSPSSPSTCTSSSATWISLSLLLFDTCATRAGLVSSSMPPRLHKSNQTLLSHAFTPRGAGQPFAMDFPAAPAASLHTRRNTYGGHRNMSAAQVHHSATALNVDSKDNGSVLPCHEHTDQLVHHNHHSDTSAVSLGAPPAAHGLVGGYTIHILTGRRAHTLLPSAATDLAVECERVLTAAAGEHAYHPNGSARATTCVIHTAASAASNATANTASAAVGANATGASDAPIGSGNDTTPSKASRIDTEENGGGGQGVDITVSASTSVESVSGMSSVPAWVWLLMRGVCEGCELCGCHMAQALAQSGRFDLCDASTDCAAMTHTCGSHSACLPELRRPLQDENDEEEERAEPVLLPPRRVDALDAECAPSSVSAMMHRVRMNTSKEDCNGHTSASASAAVPAAVSATATAALIAPRDECANQRRDGAPSHTGAVVRTGEDDLTSMTHERIASRPPSHSRAKADRPHVSRLLVVRRDPPIGGTRTVATARMTGSGRVGTRVRDSCVHAVHKAAVSTTSARTPRRTTRAVGTLKKPRRRVAPAASADPDEAVSDNNSAHVIAEGTDIHSPPAVVSALALASARARRRRSDERLRSARLLRQTTSFPAASALRLPLSRLSAPASALSSASSASSASMCLLPASSVASDDRTCYRAAAGIEHNERAMTQERAQRLRRAAPEATEVLPWLFVGGECPARDAAQLQRKAITAVVNAAADDVPAYFPHRLRYLRLYLSDAPTEPILSTLAVVNAFIEWHRQRGGRVLVHCHQGVSRSCALVMGYLMWRQGWCYDRAYAWVRSRRSVCSPNMGFYVSLHMWEQHLSQPCLRSVFAHVPYAVPSLDGRMVYRLAYTFAPVRRRGRRGECGGAEGAGHGCATGSARVAVTANQTRSDVHDCAVTNNSTMNSIFGPVHANGHVHHHHSNDHDVSSSSRSSRSRGDAGDDEHDAMDSLHTTKGIACDSAHVKDARRMRIRESDPRVPDKDSRPCAGLSLPQTTPPTGLGSSIALTHSPEDVSVSRYAPDNKEDDDENNNDNEIDKAIAECEAREVRCAQIMSPTAERIHPAHPYFALDARVCYGFLFDAGMDRRDEVGHHVEAATGAPCSASSAAHTSPVRRGAASRATFDRVPPLPIASTNPSSSASPPLLGSVAMNSAVTFLYASPAVTPARLRRAAAAWRQFLRYGFYHGSPRASVNDSGETIFFTPLKIVPYRRLGDSATVTPRTYHMNSSSLVHIPPHLVAEKNHSPVMTMMPSHRDGTHTCESHDIKSEDTYHHQQNKYTKSDVHDNTNKESNDVMTSIAHDTPHNSHSLHLNLPCHTDTQKAPLTSSTHCTRTPHVPTPPDTARRVRRQRLLSARATRTHTRTGSVQHMHDNVEDSADDAFLTSFATLHSRTAVTAAVAEALAGATRPNSVPPPPYRAVSGRTVCETERQESSRANEAPSHMSRHSMSLVATEGAAGDVGRVSGTEASLRSASRRRRRPRTRRVDESCRFMTPAHEKQQAPTHHKKQHYEESTATGSNAAAAHTVTISSSRTSSCASHTKPNSLVHTSATASRAPLRSLLYAVDEQTVPRTTTHRRGCATAQSAAAAAAATTARMSTQWPMRHLLTLSSSSLIHKGRTHGLLSTVITTTPTRRSARPSHRLVSGAATQRVGAHATHRAARSPSPPQRQHAATRDGKEKRMDSAQHVTARACRRVKDAPMSHHSHRPGCDARYPVRHEHDAKSIHRHEHAVWWCNDRQTRSSPAPPPPPPQRGDSSRALVSVVAETPHTPATTQTMLRRRRLIETRGIMDPRGSEAAAPYSISARPAFATHRSVSTTSATCPSTTRTGITAPTSGCTGEGNHTRVGVPATSTAPTASRWLRVAAACPTLSKGVSSLSSSDSSTHSAAAAHADDVVFLSSRVSESNHPRRAAADTVLARGLDFEVYTYPFTDKHRQDVMGMSDLSSEACYAVVVPGSRAAGPRRNRVYFWLGRDFARTHEWTEGGTRMERVVRCFWDAHGVGGGEAARGAAQWTESAMRVLMERGGGGVRLSTGVVLANAVCELVYEGEEPDELLLVLD